MDFYFEYAAQKNRREESIKLFKHLDLGDSVSSAVYLHVLDVIGAISCLSKKSKSKRSNIEVVEQKLFWKTLAEISLLHAKEDTDANEEENPALSTVFPRGFQKKSWAFLGMHPLRELIRPNLCVCMCVCVSVHQWAPELIL